MIKQLTALGLAGIVALSGVMVLSAQANAQVDNGHVPVTICHRTNAANNPYVVLTVDEDAVDGQSSKNGPDDHYGEHQGTLVTTYDQAREMKKNKENWGDIIPPVEGAHDGLNWTEEGQAIWNNDCNLVDEEEPELLEATAAVSTTPATCEAGETLVYGNIEFATFSGTANGTQGAADYEVVATADEDAEFAGEKTTLTFTGTLDGMLTGDDCVLGENPETPEKPETPAVLPVTGGNQPLGLYALIAGIAGLIAAGAVALRKSAFRGL